MKIKKIFIHSKIKDDKSSYFPVSIKSVSLYFEIFYNIYVHLLSKNDDGKGGTLSSYNVLE